MELKEYSQATRLLMKYRKTLDADELDLKASINQLIYYSQTKSITTACNFVQSLVAQLEVKKDAK